MSNIILKSFIDGKSYKNSSYFKKYPHALRIELNYDEVVVNNSMGSNVDGHKIGAFYFTVQNMPHELNSKISSVHLLALAYAADIKKYGIHRILKPLLDDLKELENDAGVPLLMEYDLSLKLH